MFNLNLVSFFTEMGNIQKKAKQFYSKERRDVNIFCRNSHHMTKNNFRGRKNGLIELSFRIM